MNVMAMGEHNERRVLVPVRLEGRVSAEGAEELVRASAQVREQLANVREAGAQLGVAHLDGHHRVLELGQVAVGLRDRVDRGRDKALHPRGWQPSRRGLERARI